MFSQIIVRAPLEYRLLRTLSTTILFSVDSVNYNISSIMVSFFAMGVAACFLGYMPNSRSLVALDFGHGKDWVCAFWKSVPGRPPYSDPARVLIAAINISSAFVKRFGLVWFIVQKGLVVSFPTINDTLSKRAFFQLFIQCGHRRGDLGPLQTFFGYRRRPLDPLLVSFVFCGLLQGWQCIAASSE